MRIKFKKKLKEGVKPIKVADEFLEQLTGLMYQRVEQYFQRAKEIVNRDPDASENTAIYFTKVAKDLQRNLLAKPVEFVNVKGERVALHNYTIGVDEGDENPSGEVDKGRIINTLRLFIPDVPLADYADETQDLEETYKHLLELVLKHELRHLVDIYSMEDYADPEEEPDRYYSQNMELRAFMGDFHDKLEDYLDELSLEEMNRIKREGLFNHLRKINFSLDDVGLTFSSILDSISKDKKPYKQLKKLLKPLAILFAKIHKEKSQ